MVLATVTVSSARSPLSAPPSACQCGRDARANTTRGSRCLRSFSAQVGAASSPSLAYRACSHGTQTATQLAQSAGPSEPPSDAADVPVLPTGRQDWHRRSHPWAAVPPVSIGSSRSRQRRATACAADPVRGIARLPPPPEGTRLVKIKERVATFTRAPCKRAGRRGRASRPRKHATCASSWCSSTRQSSRGGAHQAERGRQRPLPLGRAARRQGASRRAAAGGAGQDESHRAAQGQERRDAQHRGELLWGNTADQCYDCPLSRRCAQRRQLVGDERKRRRARRTRRPVSIAKGWARRRPRSASTSC